jgi:hypothetical protein
MGLSTATDKELDELLYPELNEFIANEPYLPPLDENKSNLSVSESDSYQSLGAKPKIDP